MPVVRQDELSEALLRIYLAKGVAEDEASLIVRHQVWANLAGHDSHGVIRTPRYVAQIDNGEVVPGAEFEIERSAGGTAVVNGNWGFGFVQTEKAMNLAIDLAREHGVGAVAIRYQGHVGRLGAYAAMAAEAGMVALMTADSGRGPKAVAPFGGREARLGTNPICMAVPRSGGAPVVLDMATSAVAAGKVALSRSREEQIPLGWIVDRDGAPSTNPNAYYDGGALLPLGGDQGHKGYGLSFVVEVLCGLLTGLGFGVASDGRHNDGCFLAVFDVGRFRDVDEFGQDVNGFIDYIHNTAPAVGFTEVLYPGEMEVRTEAVRRANGIPVDEATWRALCSLADELGVPMKEVAS